MAVSYVHFLLGWTGQRAGDDGTRLRQFAGTAGRAGMHTDGGGAFGDAGDGEGLWAAAVSSPSRRREGEETGTGACAASCRESQVAVRACEKRFPVRAHNLLAFRPP